VVKIGAIIEWTHEVTKFRHLLRSADSLGYDYIGIGDTPARAHDVYASLAVASYETRDAIVGPMVTTPFLRHPAVTAAAASTVHELLGGRSMLGIGAGGSAPRIVGRPTGATQQQLREYFLAVKEILNGGTAVIDGRETEPLQRVRPMPLYLAADHPRTLRMAGEVADGVIITVGNSVPFAERKINLIRTAAVDAGRDPDAIEIWAFSFVSVRDTRAEANAEIGTALASDVGQRMHGRHMRALIPPHLLAAVEEMERRYDMFDHTVMGKNAQVLKELGLVDFAADLTGITGDIDQVAAHLKDLESAGISAVFAALPALADPDGTLRRLRESASRS
jgi:5,10-methylenetetrahydromethanopterin reductase